MRFAAGVDVGSTQTKAVVIEEDSGIVARALVDTGANVTKAAEHAFHIACHEAQIDSRDVGFVVGTGYGRYKITFGNAQMTEISCHARGASYISPATRTVIDMGGQDAKAISIGADGQVLDFVMNDKCAAGTGRFLANAADVMGITLDEVGPISLAGTRPVRLTTVCTVFVESDILSYRRDDVYRRCSDAARHGSSPGRALESESRSACRLPVRVRPGRSAVGTETAAVSNARS